MTFEDWLSVTGFDVLHAGSSEVSFARAAWDASRAECIRVAEDYSLSMVLPLEHGSSTFTFSGKPIADLMRKG